MSYFIQECKSSKGGYYVTHSVDMQPELTNSVRQHFNADDYDGAESLCSKLNGGDGLTMRERFAMAAMQGLHSSNFLRDHNPIGMGEEDIAKIAIRQADALIKALKEK